MESIEHLDASSFVTQWGQVIFESQNTFQGKSLFNEVMTEHQPSYTPGDAIKGKVMRDVREVDFGLKGCCLRKNRPKAKIDDEVKAFLAQLFIRGEEQSSAKVQSLSSKLVLGRVTLNSAFWHSDRVDANWGRCIFIYLPQSLII